MGNADQALAAFHDLEPETEDFEQAVITGLSEARKVLPCKFFYDKQGSELFDRICQLEEYYPTRTEIGLLEDYGGEIAALVGKGCHLIEFGSGSSRKVRILLDALDGLAAYTAVDISKQHLLQSTAALAKDHPGLQVNAICADYTLPFTAPSPRSRPDARPVVFFPGSTVGNFAPPEAEAFLTRTAAMLTVGGGLLIGVDMKKDKALLHAAYNDRDGVTAQFNLNLLVHINRELGADFRIDGFSHDAFYNEAAGRIEMHLVSQEAQTVQMAGHRFDFAEGETIHTENSYKYTIGEFQSLGRRAGFEPVQCWTDEKNLFSLHFMARD